MQPLLIRAARHPGRAAKKLWELTRQQWPESEKQISAAAGEFWNDSATSKRVRLCSHWRGVGRWSDESAWLAMGKEHFDLYLRLCLLAGRERRLIDRMVEWGPGGGANAFAFRNEVSRFYGVDISQANLQECQSQLAGTAEDWFCPVLIDAQRPEDSRAAIGEPVDFFLSTAVFQHFPSKDYGERVTQLAYEMLSPHGLALIQIRGDDGSKLLRSKNRNYRKQAMSFTSYLPHEYWEIASRIGFNPLAVTLDPRNNYTYYLMSKGDASAYAGDTSAR